MESPDSLSTQSANQMSQEDIPAASSLAPRDLVAMGIDDLLNERARLLGLISSKEIELRQLEQMEKRLLDSQGDLDPADQGTAVKDLHDILGDFSSPVLRHVQALLLLDDVKGTHMIHGNSQIDPFPSSKGDMEAVGLLAMQDETPEQLKARLHRRDCVGLDSLQVQLDDTPLSLMICGPKGVGKTTLFHSLFKLSESSEITGKAHISLTEALVKEDSRRLKVTCVQSDPRNAPLLHAYVNELHQDYFVNELRQLVTLGSPKATDKRVHCCIYMLPPHACQSSKGLKESDISAMKLLADRVNLIPVIAKADTLTKDELMTCKRNVRDAILKNEIPVFQRGLYAEAGSGWPLAVVASYKNGAFQRSYLWGTVDVESPAVSDFDELRRLLVRTHYRQLIDQTHAVKFTNFKANLIKDLEVNELNGGEVGKKKGKKRSTIFRAGQSEKRTSAF